jgi:hypothetical protein
LTHNSQPLLRSDQCCLPSRQGSLTILGQWRTNASVCQRVVRPLVRRTSGAR